MSQEWRRFADNGDRNHVQCFMYYYVPVFTDVTWSRGDADAGRWCCD